MLFVAVEVKRKQNESVESLIRRFSKRVLQSRVIFITKAHQFRTKPKTKKQTKDAALRRNYVRSKRAYLQKIGQLPDDNDKMGLPSNYKNNSNRIK